MIIQLGLSLFAFLAVVIAVRGDTWKPESERRWKLTPMGSAAIVLGLLAGSFSIAKAIQDDRQTVEAETAINKMGGDLSKAAGRIDELSGDLATATSEAKRYRTAANTAQFDKQTADREEPPGLGASSITVATRESQPAAEHAERRLAGAVKNGVTELVAAEVGLSQAKTQEVVQKTFDLVIDLLAVHRRVELRNFGVFEVKTRSSRQARNPRTGENVDVPEKYVVTFKPGKRMEERVTMLPNETTLGH